MGYAGDKELYHIGESRRKMGICFEYDNSDKGCRAGRNTVGTKCSGRMTDDAMMKDEKLENVRRYVLREFKYDRNHAPIRQKTWDGKPMDLCWISTALLRNGNHRWTRLRLRCLPNVRDGMDYGVGVHNVDGI